MNRSLLRTAFTPTQPIELPESKQEQSAEIARKTMEFLAKKGNKVDKFPDYATNYKRPLRPNGSLNWKL